MSLYSKVNPRKDKISLINSVQKLQYQMFQDPYKDSDDQHKKQIFTENSENISKCTNCQQLMSVIKRLTLENQNLTYQIGFKDIALKKREEMITTLSKDIKLSKEQIRQLEMREIVRASTDYNNEIMKTPNKSIATERHSSTNSRQQSLPKLKQLQLQKHNPLQTQLKEFTLNQSNQLVIPKENFIKKQITFQEKQVPILISKESFQIHQDEDILSHKNSEDDLLKKKKSNTLIIRVNTTYNENELQRPSSQNELPLSQQQSLVLESKPSLSKNHSVSQMSLPFKRQSSSYKQNLKSRKLDFFQNNQIYKSLEQLKASKISQQRKLLEDQVKSVDDFAENIVREPYQTRQKIAEDIRHLLRDYIKVLDQSIALKKLTISNQKIYRCYRAQEVINTIMEEIMNNIECDHAVFYIKDQYNQQLWTADKNNDNQMVKIDPKKGILMHTLNSENVLRVEDIETDPRFVKEYDGIFHKNIKNMLCIPIKDKQNIVRGIIQIINYKKNETQVTTDEIIRLLVDNIGQQIISVLEFEQSVNNNNRIMKLMNTTLELNYIDDVRILIKKAQELLTEVFLTPQAVVYLIKDSKICINNLEKYPLYSGVIGEALTQMKLVETLDPLSHPNANFNVDIETILPVVSVPVISSEKQLVGVFQIVQDAYIRSNYIPREQIFYLESLQYFADLLAFNITRCFKNNQNQEDQQNV
ncbi:hypothetical protein ABPG74_008225 [Tetrahymena malaccensis]